MEGRDPQPGPSVDEPRHGEGQAFAAPHEILSLLESAGVIGANPAGLAEFTEKLPVQLRAAATFFQAQRRLEALPLVQELLTTLESVGAGAAGKDLGIAVSMSLELLAARLLERADANWHASQVAVVCDLRSVCGAEPLSQNPMLSASPDASEMSPEGAIVTQSGESDEASRLFLPAYREALLGLLTDASAAHAEALADVCLRASGHAANEDRARLCRSGARLFETAARCGQAGRPALRRLAVQMEQAFREQDQVEGSKLPTGQHPGLGDDLEFLRRLLLFVSADPPAEPGDPELLAAVPLPLDRRLLANTCAALADASRDDAALRARVRDAFLLLGDYERWFEAWKLDTGDAAPEAFRSAAVTWSEAFAAARGDDEPALPEKLRTHLAHAEATLRRLAEEPPVEHHAGGSEPGGISVDESLLEHLNLAAAEIRGVRSRAEANLGSLRGGFENMERAIKTLRGQLEALEVDAESPTGSASTAGDTAAGADSASVHERLGALSRGITELAELKDALNALTEDTESALAAQVSEDNELDEALLKTQLASVGTQFDTWTESVRRAAAARGVELAVEITGAEVSLERHQADALSRALIPMLEACVREGRPRDSSSAHAARAEPAGIRITVSRPRFDVVVEVIYLGAPLPPEIWLVHAVALNALGAIGNQTVGPEGTVTLGITLPGPPQAMELLVVELGESRFALPVDHLAGVSRLLRQDLEKAEDGFRVHHEGQAYPLASLASLLGVAGTADADSSERLSIVFIADTVRSAACLVDRVQGRERSLVRSPGPLLLDNPWVWGVVINDSAPPILVLDVAKL
jgi:chemotaxis protein histidine kinase CheA